MRLKGGSRIKENFYAVLCVMGLAALVIMPIACGGSSSSTGSATIPQVTGTIPADGATSVATTVMAVINFSEPMDTTSVMDNLSMSSQGLSGASTTWISGDATLNVDFSAAPLNTNTTYTITIFSDAKDKEGDKLATPVNIAFSTGTALATGSISGTISDDPQSDYDNSLENTVVAVTGSDFLNTVDITPIVIVQADSGGNFTVNHLENGTYYVVAIQDTTGDTVELDDGDSVGVYRDILAYASSAVTVTISANTVAGVDFTLHDPEAITGELTYAGADTGDLSSLAPQLYAYLGTLFNDGNFKLFSGYASSPDYYSYIGTSSPLWSYSLNPFFDSAISTTGTPDTGITGTGLTYIPPDSYHVLAYISTGVEDAVGFAPNLAVIADTGADAPGTDITLYDTYTLNGEVRASEIDTSYLYQGATVTLLDWPMMSPVSDTDGLITYDNAPAGLPFAIHAEPASADTGSFYATNTRFDTWNASDFAGTVDVELVSKNMVDQLTSLCGISIDPAKTIGGGAIQSNAGTPITGATVMISAANSLYYLSTDMQSCDKTSTQNVVDGPQFLFQADVTPSEKATVSAIAAGYTIDDVAIPVREGELTIVDMDAN